MIVFYNIPRKKKYYFISNQLTNQLRMKKIEENMEGREH